MPAPRAGARRPAPPLVLAARPPRSPLPPFPAAALLGALQLAPFAAAQDRPGLAPEMAEVAAAYAAKVAASALFVSGRTLESVLAEEFAPETPLDLLVRPLLRFDVDRERKRVTATLGRASAVAVFHPRLGCALVRGAATADALQSRAVAGAPVAAVADPAAAAREWPRGEALPDAPLPGIDPLALRRAVDFAFTEPEKGPKVRTRAVVVVKDGRLAAERYADGYTAEMSLPGWSMAKTVTSALVGIRVGEGELDYAAPPAVAAWRAPGDPRGAIAHDDLLRMQSGLAWTEDYDDAGSDALRSLFLSADATKAQAEAKLEVPPGTRFRYSSGTTNLVCGLLRRTFADDAAWWAWPHRALFDRIGARNAFFETDPDGTFVGSSFVFLRARDWARFGLFLLQDGVWECERVLPAGWMAAARTAAPAQQGRIGRHVWLDAMPAPESGKTREWPDLPEDLFYMSGHEGQYVFAFPSRGLVIVRLGCTKKSGVFKLGEFLRRVLRACSA